MRIYKERGVEGATILKFMYILLEYVGHGLIQTSQNPWLPFLEA
jgi:hypothetical protein